MRKPFIMAKNKIKRINIAGSSADKDISDKNCVNSGKIIRPVRRAVLNHKILSTNRSRLGSREFSGINSNKCRQIKQKNNNATLKVVDRKRRQTNKQINQRNYDVNVESSKNLNQQPKRANFLLGFEGLQDDLHNVGIDQNVDIDCIDDNVDIDAFDRMADQDFNNSDDDIVDVSVGGGEDQYFGEEIMEESGQRDRSANSANAVSTEKQKQNGKQTKKTETKLSEEMLLGNPEFEKLLNKLVNEKVEKKLESERRSSDVREQIDRRVVMNIEQQQQRRPNNSAIQEQNQKKISANGNNERVIKSPSDTTLYAPALRMNNSPTIQPRNLAHGLVNSPMRLRQNNPQVEMNREILQLSNINQAKEIQDDDSRNMNNIMINKISDFIEGIRLEADKDTHLDGRLTNVRSQQQTAADVNDPQPSTSRGRRDNRDELVSDEEKLSQARSRANRIILEAEQYKAQVETPKGKPFVYNNMDEEFFHIACHIEQNLKDKIEKGEFVELERLLPRNSLEADDNRMELVNKEGQMFFVRAANKENKIKNVRKWEQAFRVYAAIYSAANPHRAHEIWQYVYVINSAASCYVWDEVAQYDFMFRQLMARNRGRSWAVTYTQMWQMTLRHVVNKNGQGPNNYGYGQNQGQGNNHNSGGQRKKKHCWKFNKGKCTDPYCKYPHKCFYCDGRHGVHTCFKKNRKSGSEKGGSTPNKSK